MVHAARFAVLLRPDQHPPDVAARIAADHGAIVEPLSVDDPDILVVELPDRAVGADAFSAAHAIADAYGARAAEPDLPTALFPEPESGGGGFPAGCWSPEQDGLQARWALDAMRVPQAWSLTQGAGVVVAQPDTGTVRHRELDGIRSVGGFDFIDNDTDPTDPLGDSGNPGHGTATASVVVSGHRHHVTGSAPHAHHMAIRAIESVVRVSQVSVAKSVVWATDHGAHVITMSLGGLPSFSLDRAIQRAVDAGVIVLAAAGNCVGTVVWPARYDHCVAVAGTTPGDQRWRGSCHGAAVDMSAPGENVYRARIPQFDGDGDWGQGQGTSLAVALTAGVAALWLAHRGRDAVVRAARERGGTVQAMFQRLVRATARRPSGWDTGDMGAGVVDARALLDADLDLGVPAAAAGTGAVESLVVEVAGNAALDRGVDWERHGPEIAYHVLNGRLGGQAEAIPVSPELADAVTNPRLRALLGLRGR